MRPSPVLLAVATTLLLCACGGGGGGAADGGSSPPPPSPAQLEGVVSVGAPLANARVQVADAQGNLLGSTTAQASDGRYRLTLSKTDPALPLLVQAQGEDAGGRWQLLHSLVSSAANGSTSTVHVTPLTQASAALALGSEPRLLFAKANDGTLAATTAAVAQGADALLKTVLKTPLADLKLGDSLHLQTDAGFASSKSAADLLLEALRIQIEPAEGSLPARLQLSSKFLLSPAAEVELRLPVARSELLKGSAGTPASAISSTLKVTSSASTVLGNAATLDGVVSTLNPLLAAPASAVTLQASLTGYTRHNGRSQAQLATQLADWGARGLQLGPLQVLGCVDEVAKSNDCLRVEVASVVSERSGAAVDRLVDTLAYTAATKSWALIGNNQALGFSLRAVSWLRLGAGGVAETEGGNPSAGVELRLQHRDADGNPLIASAVLQTPLGFALPLADCGDPEWLCIAEPGGAAASRQGSLLDRLLQPGQLGWLGGLDALRGARYTVRYSLDGGATTSNQRAFLGAPAQAQPADRHPLLDGVTANAPITVAALRAGLTVKWADWAAKQPDIRMRALRLLLRDGDGSLLFSSQLPAGSDAQLSLPAVPASGSDATHELWLLAEDGQGRLLATRYRLP